MTDEVKPLTKKQEIFVNEYLQCFNGAEAARRAGYSEKNARDTASDLLANPDISRHIQSRLNEVHMSADEALKLLSDIARGDIGHFVNDYGGVDILKARENGLTKLIKKVKTKTITINGKDQDKEVIEEEIELYPADSALRDILKIHGKFTDKVDLTSGGAPLEIKIVKASDATSNSE